MIILPFIPILALIVQTSVSLNDLLKYQIDSTDTETQVSQIFYSFFTNALFVIFITDWNRKKTKDASNSAKEKQKHEKKI